MPDESSADAIRQVAREVASAQDPGFSELPPEEQKPILQKTAAALVIQADGEHRRAVRKQVAGITALEQQHRMTDAQLETALGAASAKKSLAQPEPLPESKRPGVRAAYEKLVSVLQTRPFTPTSQST